MLKMEGIKFVAIDMDPVRVQESRNAGEPVVFGDASQKDILISRRRIYLVCFCVSRIEYARETIEI